MSQPFMVQFELASPVILTDWLTLDALLAAALYERTGNFQKAHAEIPLDTSNRVHHGSVGFLVTRNGEFPAQRSMTWPKRMSLAQGDISFQHTMPGKKSDRAFELSRGPFKIVQSRYTYIMADAIRFAGCGDLEAVQELLGEHGGQPLISGIGKKRHQGYGMVRKVLYERISDDISLVNKEGAPMRPIPCNGDRPNDAPVDYTGFRPPNYREQNKSLCRLPTSPVWDNNIPASDAFGATRAIRPTDPPQDPLDYLNRLGELMHYKFAPQEKPPAPSKKQTCDTCGVSAADWHIYQTAKYGLCERCYIWARKYPMTTKQGKESTNTPGPGSAYLVSARSMIAFGPYKENPYFEARPQPSGQEERNKLLGDFILDPPEPPWIFLEGGKDVQEMMKNLVLNYGSDIITISGPNKRKIKAYLVRRAMRLISESGIPVKEVKKFAKQQNVIRKSYSEDVAEKARNQLEKLRKKYPEIDELYESLPLFGSEEFSITFFSLGVNPYA